MTSCWNENPKERPSFTELTETFDKIMSETRQYITLEIDGKSDYYLKPSFNSIPSSVSSNSDEEREVSL